MPGNCTLAYKKGGTVNAFKAWCTGYTYGFEMIASESSARRFRAYYPTRTAPTRFSVTLALRANTATDRNGRPRPNTSEYDRFGDYMANYYNYMLELQNSSGSGSTSYGGLMLVALAGRNWGRFGIPLTGVSYGDHVGSLLWTPTIVFETALDPFEVDNDISIAQYFKPVNPTPASDYFYPWNEFAYGDKDSNVYDYEQLLDYRTNPTQNISPITNTPSGITPGLPDEALPSAPPPLTGSTTISSWSS
jgi:hypothetical protein